MQLSKASVRRMSEPGYGRSSNDVKRLRAFRDQKRSLHFQLSMAELQWPVIRKKYAASHSLYIAKVDPIRTLSDPADAQSDISACKEMESCYRTLLEAKAAEIRCIQYKLRTGKPRALAQKLNRGPEASIDLSTELDTPDMQALFALNAESDSVYAYDPSSDDQPTHSSSKLNSLVERFRYKTAILDGLEEKLEEGEKLEELYCEAFARRRLLQHQELDSDMPDAQFEEEQKRERDNILSERDLALEELEKIRQQCALIDPYFDPESCIDVGLGSVIAPSAKSGDVSKEPSAESGAASVNDILLKELHRLAMCLPQVDYPLNPSDQIIYRTGSWLEQATPRSDSRRYRQPAIQDD
jgi:hypothetical protein